MKILRDALKIIWILMKWFPKFFAPLGNLIPIYGQVIVYLPEIISLLKWTRGMASKGITEIEIKKAMKNIDRAFEIEDPSNRAKELNDEFRL